MWKKYSITCIFAENVEHFNVVGYSYDLEINLLPDIFIFEN
jgi:hypothetical protein